MKRPYSRRKKRAATTLLDDIVEEGISEEISANEEEDGSQDVSNDATGTEQRPYSRRKKRADTTSLEDIVEEEIDFSQEIPANEEEDDSQDVNNDESRDVNNDFSQDVNNDATGTEQGLSSGNDTTRHGISSVGDWKYARPKMQEVNFNINFHCPESIMSDIEDRLLEFGQDTLKKFKKGPFRQLLKLPKPVGRCCKAMHYVISREMEFSGEDEMEISYFINGTRMRFRRFEFALITGLRFGKCENFDINEKYEVDDSYMWRKIFKRKKVILQDLYDMFLGIGGKTLGDDPDDYLKAAKIIFVQRFLFGQELKKTVVPEWLLILVEFPKIWNKFPWGSASFQMLLKYLRGVKRDFPPSARKTYHLFGFAYAFMAWIYCAIPEVGDQCGVLDYDASDAMPRMLRFTYEKTYPKFNTNFTQVFATLSPTEDELLTDYWQSVEPEGTKVFALKLNLDRPGGVGGSQRADRLPSNEAYQSQSQHQGASSSSFQHTHTTHVPGTVYYGPEDPIFSFAWSERNVLINDIAKETRSLLASDKEILEQIGGYVASQVVKEIMKKFPTFEEYMQGQAENSKGNEQDQRLNVHVYDSELSYQAMREKWGPTPQYTQTPGVPSVFHDPSLSEDEYPLKLQFREVRRRAELVELVSPFRPFERRGNDYAKFLRSTGIKRNVGIGTLVDVSFFKNIQDLKRSLYKEHIDAYLACIYTNPEFAGLKTVDDVTVTSSAFVTAVFDVWKNYHGEFELSPCDPNTEEEISNKELNYLSQFVIGALPKWGKMKPWFDFNKVIVVVYVPVNMVTLCIDLVEACITIYDPVQNKYDDADFEDKMKCFVPLARIVPQVIRYSGFYDARRDVIPNCKQWKIKFPDESEMYIQGGTLVCGSFALKQAEAILSGNMEPFDQKDVKKYRVQVAETIYSFSTSEETLVVD